MNIDAAFPSKYLKASDFDEGDQILTISAVEVETVGQGDDAEQKPIVYFSEIDKGLVLNKTNANSIKALYGNDTDGWAGKRLALYGVDVPFGAEMKPAVRIRSKTPQAAANSNYTLPQARAALELAGVSLEDFKANLPLNADGKPVYSPGRDSHVVDELIAQAKMAEATEIPF